MPRKAPRRATKSKSPTRPAKSGAGRGHKGAGVIAGAILLSIGALLVKAIIKLTPNKEQLKAFWAKRWARRATLAGIGLLACVLTMNTLKANLEEDSRYQIDPAGIEIASGKISWLNDAGSDALLARIRRDLSADLGRLNIRNAFDETLLEEAALQIENSPWVARVVSVARSFPTEDSGARLSAEILVRKPILRVRLDETIYFIDQEGVALPLEMPSDARWQPTNPEDRLLYDAITQKVRFVTSVSGKRPEVGKPWDNEQVKAALSMEKTLREHQVGAFLPIAQIDVGDINPKKDWRGQPMYESSGGVILYPETSATKVIWGKAEIHAGSFEASVETKLERLKKAVTEDPSLASQNQLRLNSRG